MYNKAKCLNVTMSKRLRVRRERQIQDTLDLLFYKLLNFYILVTLNTKFKPEIDF